MPAYEIPNLRFSAESGGVIANRRFVVIDANENVVQATDATKAVVGVAAVNATKAGEVVEIYDGIVMVEAGGAITAGTEVMPNADAKAVVYADGAGTNIKAGYAMTNASAAGELVAVKI